MPAHSDTGQPFEEADRLIHEFGVMGAAEAIEVIADGLKISLPVDAESASFQQDVIDSLRNRAREIAATRPI